MMHSAQLIVFTAVEHVWHKIVAILDSLTFFCHTDFLDTGDNVLDHTKMQLMEAALWQLRQLS